MTLLAPTLEAFFSERLIAQRRASPHTVSAYRDTFRLLLAFAESQTGRAPSKLRLEDLDAALVAEFLQKDDDGLRSHRLPGERTGQQSAHAQRATGGNSFALSLRGTAPP